jgi:hypothetical protein
MKQYNRAIMSSRTIRRGGVLFKDNSQYKLQHVKYASAEKGILKVVRLEDSLRSTLRDSTTTKPRRSSLNLESLTSSLRNLFAGSNHNNNNNNSSPRGCASLPTGMDLDLANGHESGTTVNDLDQSQQQQQQQQQPSELPAKTVQFTDIHMRLYPVAPDDNPAVSRGPAIALSGWNYKTLTSMPLDQYESTRSHSRRAMENLKLDMTERRRRLMEHGASQREIADFARRAQRAKRMRLETLQAAKIYGKHHEERLERREEQRGRMRVFLSRALGIRRTDSEQQSALWDSAQQQ